MAGMPLKREKLKAAEVAADDARARLDVVRLGLIRDGIDPNKYDPDKQREPVALKDYSPALPLACARLANEGRSIEEIRIALGFTAKQEGDWIDSYVDFAAALARVREREEAFWQGQARQAAKTGDRPGFTAISALIQKRFTEAAHNQDASMLLHTRPGSRRDQPSNKDE